MVMPIGTPLLEAHDPSLKKKFKHSSQQIYEQAQQNYH